MMTGIQSMRSRFTQRLVDDGRNKTTSEMASPLLHHLQGYIDGVWRSAASAAIFRVLDPACGDSLAEVPDMGEEDTRQAIASAVGALAYPASLAQRREWLATVATLLEENQEAFGRIITREQGKPLRESMEEVLYAAGFFAYYADRLDHLLPRILDSRERQCDWIIYHRPAGVAGVIAPWNFPLAMLAKKLAPAIGAGCSVVAKPSELTPLSAIALWSVFEQAEIPKGKLNLVIGQPAPIGSALCAHPAVRLISFTGSTSTGKLLLRETAAHVKRLALELGGNAPFIVFEDADLTCSADALVRNRFRAGGQTCVCANRVYVERSVANRFTDAVADRVRGLRTGNGMDSQTDIGPLINRAAFDKVANHVQDAIAKGAQRIVGYDPPRPTNDWGCYYPPILLTNIRPEMLVCQEETFGPVVAIGVFEDEQQVIDAGNGTDYGLAAYVFTNDKQRADRVINRLSFGHVGLNTGTGPIPHAPFGGMKQSGFGREGGLEGLLEFCEVQTVAAASLNEDIENGK